MAIEPKAAPGGPHAGLCETCFFQRVVTNTRGSRFLLCNRSREDPAYPRYPRVPVLRCGGHLRRGAEARPGAPEAGGSG